MLSHLRHFKAVGSSLSAALAVESTKPLLAKQHNEHNRWMSTKKEREEHQKIEEQVNKAEAVYEKGTKKLMESDEGRETLNYGSFCLDDTTEKIVQAAEEHGEEISGDEQQEEEVKSKVKGQVVSMNQPGS